MKPIDHIRHLISPTTLLELILLAIFFIGMGGLAIGFSH